VEVFLEKGQDHGKERKQGHSMKCQGNIRHGS
jgi:hypothetical protein